MRPQRQQPTRLPHPWDSPGKNTGVGCHFLLQCIKVKSEVAQSCPTLCDPMDCSLPGSSIHGIFQARVLEWGAIASSIFHIYIHVKAGRLQSMESQRVRHDWATSLSLFTFMHWRRKWQPTPVFLPGESQGRGAWQAAVYGVAQSQTQLKWLSSSSKSYFKLSLFITFSKQRILNVPGRNIFLTLKDLICFLI